MPSLVLYDNRTAIFQDDGPWLYPLLALEKWLEANAYDRSGLSLYDKVIGRAGALLIVRLGIRSVKTDLMSRLAETAFEKFSVHFETEVMTDRILCQTEELLEGVLDPQTAYDLIQKRISARKSDERLDPVLVIRDLNVLRDGRHVLSSLDMRIEFGEKVLITGINGAGKTTLIRTILGLLPAASGHVHIMGVEVGSSAWKRERRHVGYVRQDEGHVAMPITVAEVVSIGAGAPRRNRRSRVSDALDSVDALHLIGRAVSSLSGGERQRVSIARALAQAPKLLLLDEPTAGLDSRARETLLGLVDKLSQNLGLTVLVVSHDVQPERVFDWRTLHLASGQLSEAG